MPIYEFRCEGCQSVFEHLAMTSGNVLELKCPDCGGQELSRVMSTCSSVITGGGSAAPECAPSPGCASVQNRSCPNAGNCSTLTLPGGD